MAFVCSATWTAKENSADIVRDALAQLSPASREEQGNIYYQAYQDPAQPHVFRIFEVYVDEDAFAAHGQYDHFKKWALEQAIPVLESRVRDFYTTLDV